MFGCAEFLMLMTTKNIAFALLMAAGLGAGSLIPAIAQVVPPAAASTPAAAPKSAQPYFATASSASARWGKDYLPNLPVLDQDGNQFNFYDDLIAGKNVVINFIFTTCNDICPLTTARMALVQEKLGNAVGRDVFMYSISIDPEIDRPAQLKNYAEAFRIAPGWKLLTGKPEDIAVIRHKLGERSKVLKEHRHEMLIGNADSGSWSKDSAFGDIERVVINIRSMDPNWRYTPVAQKRLPSSEVEKGNEAIDVNYKPGEALFIKGCSTCHTIGKGDRVGPDLRGVSSRRDHNWLKGFISRPDRVFDKKDPVAMAMLKKYRGIRMPNLGLSEQDAEDVLAYLDAQTFILASAEAGVVHDHSKHVAEEQAAHDHSAHDHAAHDHAKHAGHKHQHKKQ
jgi:protein SCO1